MTAVSSPHLPVQAGVSRVMRQVVLALVPGIAVYTALFGYGILINLLLAAVTALVTEGLMLRLRGRPVARFLSDWSAPVTALLLGLALPPLAPWWLVVLGTAFALVFGKHLYGGLGYNPFNPAMLGYVVLLISFPTQMTLWPPVQPLLVPTLSLAESLQYTFTGALPAGMTLDVLTGATPLDHLKTQLGLEQSVTAVREASSVFGLAGGAGWEWVNLGFLAGGLWLLARGTIRWQIPAGVLAGLALIALPFWLANPEQYASPLFHLSSGAAILGAFFIATDPVSASTTPRGRLIYGLCIGVLTWIIRNWGGYPDAIAFAVLLMNMAAPTIDEYTQPRVYGQPHRRKHRGD